MKISEKILNLVPYQTGKPIDEAKREYGLSQVCKLASNENPLGPSPMAIEAIKNELHQLHRYPDGGCYDLKHHMSRHFGLDPNWLMFGNGSNEIIDLLIRLYCEPGDEILTSRSAFIAYKLCAQAARVDVKELLMTQDLKFNVEEFLKYLSKKSSKTKLIFLSNPNNPTGTYLNKDEFENFFSVVGERDDLIIIIDEAYFEFVRAKDYPNGQEFLNKYHNIVVLRTMSKVYGLAGLRLGIGMARPEIVSLFHRIRNPFNVNSLAQVATIAALNDKTHIQNSQNIVWEGLDFFYKELTQLELPYTPSQGNFLLFDTKRDAGVMSHELLKLGVIMRPVQAYGFPTSLRLSVGLPHENKMAIDALKKIIGSSK